MARGERARRIKNNAGREYYKKRGFLEKCWGWLVSVSSRPKTNKITKRLTNKSERKQVRKWIRNSRYNDFYEV